MQLEVCGNWIFGDGIKFEVEYPALEAVLLNGRVFVTFDWMAFERNAPVQNIFLLRLVRQSTLASARY